MKRAMVLIGLLLSAWLPACGRRSAPDYLGQPPPGDTAVLFAPGIVSDGRLHGRLAISPDGRDIFWAIFSSVEDSQGVSRLVDVRIMHAMRWGGAWTAPEAAFPADLGMTADPLFSPDGKRLYFGVTTDPARGWQRRYVERTGQGWSEPREGGPRLKSGSSFTRSGRAYYSDRLAGKPWNVGIFVADGADSGIANPRALPPEINSPFIDYTPFVAPDESYLMFSSSRPSPEEKMFLWISFRASDGTWSPPRRMNDALGFTGHARFPALSPDGRFLFFCGDDGNMYWVRSRVIDRLRGGAGSGG